MTPGLGQLANSVDGGLQRGPATVQRGASARQQDLFALTSAGTPSSGVPGYITEGGVASTMNGSACLLFATIAAVLLIPLGTDGAYAAGLGGEAQAAYELGDIERAFSVMEEYVTYNHDKNISFDVVTALRDGSTSQLDVDIALEFAMHSNRIINATRGSLTQTNELEANNIELVRALQEFEEGRFRSMFGDKVGPIGSASGIMPALHEQTDALTSSTLASPENALQETSHRARSHSTACGGSFQSPSPEPPVIPKRWFSSEDGAERHLTSNGYHRVPQYASANYGNDFAKTTSAYGCNNGEMRSQAIVFQSGIYWRHSTQSPEPNPEILSYDWPVYWWGAYVAWWHVRD